VSRFQPRPLSGTQYSISGFGYTAEIASVGATLRVLQHHGRDLIASFPAADVRPYFRGVTLAPWPNRVVDGRYRFRGTEHRLALTEPERGHALHGLACWLEFTAVQQSAEAVALAAIIEPQAGYPYRLQVQVTFTCTKDGLRTEVVSTNIGADVAPYGTAPHPYLVAGSGRVDDWTLQLAADRVATVTEDRLIPTGIADVGTADGGQFDFRRPRRIESTMIDHAFTDLHRDGSGTAATVLTDRFGRGVRMTWGPQCPWVQVHTADLADQAKSRLGLAVEPMTCPPDAFNSGTDLIELEPGQLTSASWIIAAQLSEGDDPS
jgi:aldose 1-epimerase